MNQFPPKNPRSLSQEEWLALLANPASQISQLDIVVTDAGYSVPALVGRVLTFIQAQSVGTVWLNFLPGVPVAGNGMMLSMSAAGFGVADSIPLSLIANAGESVKVCILQFGV